MTIGKGTEWGEPVARPGDLIVAADDADLATRLADPGGRPVAAGPGDVRRTVGDRPVDDRDELLRVPVDLLRVRLDDAEPVVAVAHVVASSPPWSGGWLRGELLVVMNAEFLGDLDLVPRGHLNDGRVETLRIGAGVGVRQRLAMRRRARNASHLPHPAIETRSVRTARWTFDRPRRVMLDGVVRGTGRTLAVEVVPDAATLLI